MIVCWSTKGGSGTTTVAAAMAALLAGQNRSGVLLVDLAGDLPDVLGTSVRESTGIAEWLQAGEQVPVDALARLETVVRPGLALLCRGEGEMSPARGRALAAVLANDHRSVVVDAGCLTASNLDSVAATLAERSQSSVLVMRSCYLGIRRAVALSLRPSAIVLLQEEGRVYQSAEVAEAVGVPVVAQVRVHPSVARGVDAGLLATRLPRTLARDLRPAAGLVS